MPRDLVKENCYAGSPELEATGHETQPTRHKQLQMPKEPERITPPEPKKLRSSAEEPRSPHQAQGSRHDDEIDGESSESSHVPDHILEVDYF